MKNKKKKAPPSPLPPLRKITFDSRGQKKVVDLGILQDDFMYADGEAEEDLEVTYGREDENGDKDALEEPELETEVRESQAEDREAGMDSKSGMGVQGMYANMDSGNQGWRSREKGAPRRTAWR